MIFAASEAFFIGMTLLFLSQLWAFIELLSIYKKAQNSYLNDPFWILVALGFGLLAHLLLIIALLSESFWLLELSKLIATYLFLIFLTLIVAQRMVPFFSHSHAERNDRLPLIVFVALALKSLAAFVDIALLEIAIDLALGSFMLYEVLRWRLHTRQAAPILWISHLALYWFIAALFIDAVALVAEQMFGTNSLFLGLHLLLLGFLTTILIGFGSRVTLGHSGQRPHADSVTLLLFYFTILLVLARAALSFSTLFEHHIAWLFDLSITLWILLFVGWAARYAKVLLFQTPSH